MTAFALLFVLETSPALSNLQQTLKVMTVQKETMHTNVTTFRDDLRGIARGPRALSPARPRLFLLGGSLTPLPVSVR